MDYPNDSYSSFRGEHPLTLRQVADHLPKRNGKKVHYSTIYRWSTKGARGRILESFLVGGIRYTTIEAVQRFLNSKPAERDDAHTAKVEKALRDAGL